MKILIILILFLFFTTSTKKNEVAGSYHDYFGSSIQLNSNHTYNYHWSLCMNHSWIQGQWEMSDDTILLNPILVFDTIYYFDSLQYKYSDSLVLSLDSIPEHITPNKNEGVAILSGGQNLYGSPRKLFYKDGKLFNIDKEGKVQRGKRKGFINGHKKYPTYYLRDN
ncbi:MAG: hypothetical protein KAG64_02650 [Bacteroidales bacterium]|nr:hypothetical protein [Bacteroidales bacterium]